jgi:RNA polymerase sigma factor (sigma-70 family)
LDYPTDQEKSNTYYTYIEDPKTKSPVQVLQEQERLETIKTKVRDLINDETISEQQREYIRLYYYEGMTFDQIGKRFSLTREAIRQSIKKAIKAIRENNMENEHEYL